MPESLTCTRPCTVRFFSFSSPPTPFATHTQHYWHDSAEAQSQAGRIACDEEQIESVVTYLCKRRAGVGCSKEVCSSIMAALAPFVLAGFPPGPLTVASHRLHVKYSQPFQALDASPMRFIVFLLSVRCSPLTRCIETRKPFRLLIRLLLQYHDPQLCMHIDQHRVAAEDQIVAWVCCCFFFFFSSHSRLTLTLISPD